MVLEQPGSQGELHETHVPSLLQVPLAAGPNVISSKVNPPLATHTRMVYRPASRRTYLDRGDGGSGRSP